MIFVHRIKTRFHGKGESYMLLSKSMYKLEAEIWDEEDALKPQFCSSSSSTSATYDNFDRSSSSGIGRDDERVTKCMMVDVLEPFVDEDGEVDLVVSSPSRSVERRIVDSMLNNKCIQIIPSQLNFMTRTMKRR